MPEPDTASDPGATSDPGAEGALRHADGEQSTARVLAHGLDHPTAFALLRPLDVCADARFDESLLEPAAAHGPVATIWQTAQSLVVPRSYHRFEAFDTACEDFALQGWPITVRQTGGGIVPQGPGILNLSLAYRVEGPPMRYSEPGYRLICRILADALDSLGIDTFPAPVEGSFCDGRYNLAVQLGGMAVKIAGTAQTWRRIRGGENGHIGLIHALVLLDADTAGLTRIANAFETAIESERRYRPDRVVSVAELLGTSHGLRARFEQALERALAAVHPS